MDAVSPERHLLEYWAILKRRRWVVFLGVAVVGTVALVASLLTTPLYRATATLQIERQNPDVLSFKDLATVDYSFSAYANYYQTQYKILASDAVARITVERAGLMNHPRLAHPPAPGLLARLRGAIPRSAAPVPADPLDAMAATVLSRLEVTPIRNSHLVQVSWVSDDPALAAQVANAAAESYIAFNLRSSYMASDQASEFLVGQVGTLRREIDEIEARLQSYGEAKRIVAVDDANNITLRALSDIAKRRTEAQNLLAEKEAAWRAVQETPAEALPEVLRSDLIARLKQENASLEAEHSEKSKVFREEWPGMVQLRSKMEQTAARLTTETEAIGRSVRLAAEAEYRRAKDEVENFGALLARQEAAAQVLKRDAVEFLNLQSEAQKKRETLNALIKRQNEMALSTRLKEMDATSSNVKIVDRAKPPAGPFRPSKTFNTLFGIVLGGALGVGLALFLDYMDSSVASPADVERLTTLPTLAMIPRHGAAATGARRRRRRTAGDGAIAVDLVAHKERGAGISEAYRELRTAILLSNAGRPPRRIMVTSALPEEGKSATAMNLAVVLAQMGRRVLLVDTDLRRPRLHRAFGLDNARGMSTFLSGLEKGPLDLARPTGVDNLAIVTSGPVPPNPSELLNGPGFAAFAEAFLAAGYDHVLFDSPPALSVADPVIIAQSVDAPIVVVRAHRTPRESLRLAIEKFTHAGAKPIGVVLNDVDVEGHGYYRYHYRYYGHDDAAPAASVDDRGKDLPASRAG